MKSVIRLVSGSFEGILTVRSGGLIVVERLVVEETTQIPGLRSLEGVEVVDYAGHQQCDNSVI
jgi:hypothetical protein